MNPPATISPAVQRVAWERLWRLLLTPPAPKNDRHDNEEERDDG